MMDKPMNMWVLVMMFAVTVMPGIEHSARASSYGLEFLDSIMQGHTSQLCFYINCQEPILSGNCPSKTIYMENTSQFGCCGACVAFRQADEDCTGNIDPSFVESNKKESTSDTNFLDSLNNTSENNIVHSSWCDYSLKCKNHKCSKEDTTMKTCRTILDSFLSDTANSNIYKPYRDDYRWKPECTPEGKFAAKQCKGPLDRQRCVCVDPDGKRLFGAAFPEQGELFSTMNCKCSRHAWEKQQAGELSDTVHCLENGNFEPLQCEENLCYCVEPITGEVYGPLLPETAMYMLPCYNKTTTGEQYLRRCESELHAHNKLFEAMANSGVRGPESLTPCDQDGSFASKQCDQEMCLCWDKYKYQSIAHPAGSGCQCARDRAYYKETDSKITVSCNVTGGTYIQEQVQGSYKFCVDQDGIRTGPMVQNSNEYYLVCESGILCQEGSSDYCSLTCLTQDGECPEKAYAGAIQA